MKNDSPKCVIVGGCLDFKNPAGLSFSAMKGLTRELASSGHPNLHCEQSFDVPIQYSIGAHFYFYHIRSGGQEKSFIFDELRKMHLRPASLYESTSLANVEFSRLRSAIACIDPRNNLFREFVPLVCLAVTMVADDHRFHPVLKCRVDRGMVVGQSLPIDGLVPVTDHCFDCWKA
jgi:hypothetical protein